MAMGNCIKGECSAILGVSKRALGQHKSIKSEVEADKLDLDLPVTKEDQKTNDKAEGKEDDFKTDCHDHELSVQDEHENGAKPKRKRKERTDKKIPGTCSGSHNNTIKEEDGKQDEDKSTSLDPVVFVQEEQNQKQQSFVTFNVDQSAEESHSKKKEEEK
ncbi:hypothetical protein NC653_018214 [Populus alba x Populus x berolinensis]|uniref:Uncharacterized protein n=1 Tax=Populus alba x Populus x berolinensis TaxID=444605 RepID=A0AAD6VUU5_9ROSI|nr:hypothetical protein NC653_018214 [Populus alba x Populus x berolinensis]